MTAVGRLGDWIDGNGPPGTEKGNVRDAFATASWNRTLRDEFEKVGPARATVELRGCVCRIWKDATEIDDLQALTMALPDIGDDFVMDMALARLEAKSEPRERVPDGTFPWDLATFKIACELVFVECIGLRAADFAIDFERAREAKLEQKRLERQREREEKARIKAEKKARREARRLAKAQRAREKKER